MVVLAAPPAWAQTPLHSGGNAGELTTDDFPPGDTRAADRWTLRVETSQPVQVKLRMRAGFACLLRLHKAPASRRTDRASLPRRFRR